jgi:flagellar biosynthesis/type III secretory pathway M-ring protein FliF/YscJ
MFSQSCTEYFSMENFIKIFFLGVAVYGGLYLLGTSGKQGYRVVRMKKKSQGNRLSREAKTLEIIKEADKRKQKQDKISELAKRKPERIASAIQKWLLENDGKPIR